MRGGLSSALGLALALGGAVPAALADWGAFYQSTTPAPPRTQATGLSDRTGMHPQANRRTFPRLSAPPFAAAPQMMPTAPFVANGDPTSICVAEILRAQARYGIPDNMLLGIGLQEAGVSRGGRLTVWPWAVNAAGEGRIFESRDAAMAWVRERQAAGVQSIDVGCMQINLRWHPGAFATLEEGFDPVINIDYAARFLAGLYAETGDWMRAGGAYHSRTPEKAAIYLSSLRRNVAVANDRIDGFRGMAGAGPAMGMRPETIPATTYSPDDIEQAQADPVTPWDHGHWSTQQEDPGGVYGIYSRDRLEPVLPRFLQDF
ncbi:MAG: lytic transglycosylase domain-containing protein [Paracoccaceae bacterium]|nr:lytic transglycosylase domain-containing protein [Paracoccaceae bacterium]